MDSGLYRNMHVCRHMSLLSNTGQLLKKGSLHISSVLLSCYKSLFPWHGPTWAHCTCEQCPQCFPPFLVLTSTSLKFPPLTIWQNSSSKTPPSSLFHVLLSGQCDLYDVVSPLLPKSKKYKRLNKIPRNRCSPNLQDRSTTKHKNPISEDARKKGGSSQPHLSAEDI